MGLLASLSSSAIIITAFKMNANNRIYQSLIPIIHSVLAFTQGTIASYALIFIFIIYFFIVFILTLMIVIIMDYISCFPYLLFVRFCI